MSSCFAALQAADDGAFGQIDLFPLGRDGDGEVFGLLLQVDQAHFVKDVQADADAAHGAGGAGVAQDLAAQACKIVLHPALVLVGDEIAPDGGKVRAARQQTLRPRPP